MQQKRTEWKAKDRKGEIEKLVFLDESGVNIDMTRRYGRSIGKQRVVGHVPLNTPKTLTILRALCGWMAAQHIQHTQEARQENVLYRI